MTTTATAPAAESAGNLETGRVVAIAGPVVDVEFAPHALPEINTALEIDLVLSDFVRDTFRFASHRARGRCARRPRA